MLEKSDNLSPLVDGDSEMYSHANTEDDWKINAWFLIEWLW